MGSTGKSSSMTPLDQPLFAQEWVHEDGYWDDYGGGDREWREGFDGYVAKYSAYEQREMFENMVNATSEQIQALQDYARGLDDNNKVQFGIDNGIDDIIKNSTNLHLHDATLFRGGNLSDQEFADLQKGKLGSMFDGFTSWSLREDVAHMYAQGDNGEVFGGRPASGHRVIFVETNTNDAMALPYASAHDEGLRSSDRKYTITKIIPESKYKKIRDPFSGNSGYDEPVTYVYVKSRGK